MLTVNLYEAKTRLSALVEQAAAGEEIIIAKNGIARARLVPITERCGSVESPMTSTCPILPSPACSRAETDTRTRIADAYNRVPCSLNHSTMSPSIRSDTADSVSAFLPSAWRRGG